MTNRKMIGPVATIAAVGIVGSGWWLVNTAQNPNPSVEVVRAAMTPAADSPPDGPPEAAGPPAPKLTGPAAPDPTGSPAPESFPQQAEYVADIPLQGSVLTVEITIDGRYAQAYACDDAGLETWLAGPATDGAVALTDKTGSDRLDGQLRRGAIVGTLWVGERSWQVEATRVGPAGEY